MKAAHFLLIPELATSPPNEAIVRALLTLGYQIDLYAPGAPFPIHEYGPKVTTLPVEYGKRWILKNVFRSQWRHYDLFSGTSEDPMAVVGVLSWIHRRPAITLADEIKNGSYAGNRPSSWKRLCRWGMRRSKLTIVNDENRISLQREYANLTQEHPIIVYPGCFHDCPEPIERISFRSARGIPEDAFVLAFSGTFGYHLGAEWMLAALQADSTLHVMAQIVNLDPLTQMLLTKIRGAERLYLERTRLSWRESWASMAAADIGMVIYHHDAPQFQNMGTSSNRLCMFLSMGVPVIVSRQPSFEFVERYNCGVMVESEQQFLDAVSFMKNNFNSMRSNACRAAREYIDAPGKYKNLLSSLSILN